MDNCFFPQESFTFLNPMEIMNKEKLSRLNQRVSCEGNTINKNKNFINTYNLTMSFIQSNCFQLFGVILFTHIRNCFITVSEARYLLCYQQQFSD